MKYIIWLLMVIFPILSVQAEISEPWETVGQTFLISLDDFGKWELPEEIGDNWWRFCNSLNPDIYCDCHHIPGVVTEYHLYQCYDLPDWNYIWKILVHHNTSGRDFDIPEFLFYPSESMVIEWGWLVLQDSLEKLIRPPDSIYGWDYLDLNGHVTVLKMEIR